MCVEGGGKKKQFEVVRDRQTDRQTDGDTESTRKNNKTPSLGAEIQNTSGAAIPSVCNNTTACTVYETSFQQ